MKFLQALLASALTTVLLAMVSCTAGRESGDGWQTWFKEGLDGAKVVSGNAKYRVENGVLIGTTTEGSPNSFLVKGPFKDFELEFEVNVDDELNSGVQVRSHIAKEGDARSYVVWPRRAAPVYRASPTVWV